ncbi:twin-arginine translocase subunit TatC [Natrialbaceae archaeon A-gly3]
MADEPDGDDVDPPENGERTQDASADATESTEPGSTDAESETDSVSGGLDVTVSEDLEDEDEDEDELEDERDELENTDEAEETSAPDDGDDTDESTGGGHPAAPHNRESEDEVNPVIPGEESERREAKTDGEGVVDDVPEREREDSAYPDPDDDIGGLEAPPDDEEMPLADHIEEMILRLAVVLLFGSAATAIGVLWASPAIEFIWLEVFPASADEVPPPHVYHPLELWLTRIKVAALLGIMVALPAFVYQCYLFMRPGLYPNERKYYLAAVPTSVVLAGVGMLFSFFVVLPILFEYFTFYAEGSAEIAYALGETFNLIITLTGFLAVVFQIPLFIMLAIMMGVTTRRWLAQKRLYFWAAFAGLSFMFTVDPTMMAPVIVALVMILLFEGTLLVLRWVGRE